MMKKVMTMFLAMVMLLTAVTGCGSKTEDVEVDLQSFYADVADECEWDDNYMVDMDAEMMEAFFPGLSEISTKQMIAKMAIISAAVNEVVFLQCETEEDAGKAAGILQQRVDMQAEGGAWYPEAVEAWGRASVIQQGTYVAMIASAQSQGAIEEDFRALFA